MSDTAINDFETFQHHLNRDQSELDASIAGSNGGRPRKPLNWETFESLCAIQCTLAEIASVFRTAEDIIERWCLAQTGLSFTDCFKLYSGTGRASLRRYQFAQAEKNPIMAIWLGKNWLGQTDRIETTSTNLTVVTTASRADVNAMTPTEIQERIQALLGGAVPSGQVVEEPE